MKKFSTRFFAALLIILLLAASAAPAFSAATGDVNFAISCSTASARPRELTDVSIVLTNSSGRDIQELEFVFEFDSTRVAIAQIYYDDTTNYSTTMNGISYPNNNSPVTLKPVDSNKIKIYNYDPDNSASVCTPLRAGSTLIMKFPMVVINDAPTGSMIFTVSSVNATDSTGALLSVGDLPQATFSVAGKSNDATLSSINVSVNNSPVTLDQPFSSGLTIYSVSLLYTSYPVALEAKCTDQGRATYKIDGPEHLAVGSNVYTFTVTAEDGSSTKVYTLTINRLAPGETLPQTTTSSTTATTTESTTDYTDMPSPPTSTTESVFIPEIDEEINEEEGTLPAAPDEQQATTTAARSGATLTLNLASLLGIVGAAIAIFLLAFAAGYITHKNAAEPQKYSVDELMKAQEKLEMQNKLTNMQQNQGVQQNAPLLQNALLPPAAAPLQQGFPLTPNGVIQQGFGDPVQSFNGAPQSYGDPSQVFDSQYSDYSGFNSGFQGGYNTDPYGVGGFAPQPEATDFNPAGSPVPDGTGYAPTDVFYQ